MRVPTLQSLALVDPRPGRHRRVAGASALDTDGYRKRREAAVPRFTERSAGRREAVTRAATRPVTASATIQWRRRTVTETWPRRQRPGAHRVLGASSGAI